MSIHVQPRTLDTPLPGGQAGATVTVEPLITGEIQMSQIAMDGSGGRFASLRVAKEMLGRSADRVPVPAFLIRHPGAGPILVDTGLHPSVAADPKHSFGRILGRILDPTQRAGDDVISQLRQRDIEPGDVRTVVLTHLHVDHASAISELPDATFVVSSSEWDAAARGSRPTANGYRRAQIDHAFDYRVITYENSRVDSYSSFGRTFDLFGDSSVRLALTSGHSAGHQSVICRLHDRDMVIGGDAAYTERQIHDQHASLPMQVADEHNYRRSLQEIRLFHRQYPEAMITPGHDPGFYARFGAQVLGTSA